MVSKGRIGVENAEVTENEKERERERGFYWAWRNADGIPSAVAAV